MKNTFAMTKNVQRFLAGVEMVQQPIKGRIGNALFYGPPGTGKTKVGQWYAAQNGIPYVRSRDITSRKTLLANISAELGLDDRRQTSGLFDQIVESQIDRPNPIIIDEVDYLVRGGVVEVLRDISDMTNTPIIMMGMEALDRKLKRFKHLYDRFTAIVRFELFDQKEVAALAGQICDVPLAEDAIAFIAREGEGKLRLTTTWFARAEQLAKRNKYDVITADHLRGYSVR